MVSVRPIRTEEDYQAALARLSDVFQAPIGTPEGDERDVLADLIEHYEDEHYPIGLPTAIGAIEFVMDQRDMTRRDLIPFIGSASKVSEVLSGKRDITMAMARALHKHLGIPADVLLQDPSVSFDENEPELDWKRFPLKAIAGWAGLENARNLKDQAEEIVSGLMDRSGAPQVAMSALFRKNDLTRVNAKADPYALTAWCWQVMAQANESPPDAEFREFEDWTEACRAVARVSRYAEGPRLAKDVLAAFGIALEIVPHLPRTYLDGASMLLPDGRPVIGLTLRYDRIDNFWFTLLHELAHVALHLNDDSESPIFIDDLSLRGPRMDTQATEDVEIEADLWAEDALIPLANEEEELLLQEAWSPIDIIELAQKYAVHPAVIAGRVRYDRRNYRLLSQFVGSREVRKQFGKEEVGV